MDENNLDAAGMFNVDKHVIPPLHKPQKIWTVTSKRGVSIT